MHGFFEIVELMFRSYLRVPSLSYVVGQNGIVSGAPFIASFLVQLATGLAVDMAIRKTRLSPTTVKKVSIVSGTYGGPLVPPTFF